MTHAFYDYRSRMLVCLLVAILIASLVVGLIIDLGRTRTSLMHAKAMQTQHLVEVGHTVIEHYYDLQKQGKLSESVAKNSALNAIRSIRYAGSEYFWINDNRSPYPVMIMHPTLPKLEGKILDDPLFESATHIRHGSDSEFETLDKPRNLFLAFHQATQRQGYGFVRYQWPKPLNDGSASAAPYPKLSFGKTFAPWGWMIGSGIYIDDIDQAILDEAEKKIAYNLLICAILLVISFFVIQGIGHIENQQQQSKKRMQALIDATSESVLLLDAQGKILMINHFGAQRFQTTPDQLVGKNFFGMIPESVAKSRRMAVEETLLTGEPVTVIDERAGIQFENNMYPVRSLHDDPDCVAVYAKDITDRHRYRLVDEIFRRLDSALLKWQIHSSTLSQLFCNEVLPVFNLSAAWIGKLGPNGDLQWVAHSEIEGLDFLSPLKKSPSLMAAINTWPPVQTVLNQGCRHIMRRPATPENAHEQLAAAKKIDSALALPLHFKNTTWGVLIVYHTDHRNLEANLRRLSMVASRLSLSLESAHQQDWLSLLNAAVLSMNTPLLFADEAFNVTWANPALATLIGADRDSLLGHPVSSILPEGLPEDRAIDTVKTPAQLRHQQGHLIPVSVSINTLKNEEDSLRHSIIYIETLPIQAAPPRTPEEYERA